MNKLKSGLIIIGILNLLILISGCSNKIKTVEKPIIVKEPVKCEIPEIPEPQYIIPNDNDTYSDILKKLLYNYAECRNYNEKLKKALEVCR